MDNFRTSFESSGFTWFRVDALQVHIVTHQDGAEATFPTADLVAFLLYLTLNDVLAHLLLGDGWRTGLDHLLAALEPALFEDAHG